MKKKTVLPLVISMESFHEKGLKTAQNGLTDGAKRGGMLEGNSRQKYNDGAGVTAERLVVRGTIRGATRQHRPRVKYLRDRHAGTERGGGRGIRFFL